MKHRVPHARDRAVRNIAIAAALALSVPPSGAWAQGSNSAPDPLAVLEEAGRAYHAVPAVCAEFRQTLTVPLLDEDRAGRGRLCSQPPDRFAMRFAEPPGDLVVADGRWLWLYQPSADARQVLRSELVGGPRGIDFYREFLAAPRTKSRAEYRGRATLDGRAARAVSERRAVDRRRGRSRSQGGDTRRERLRPHHHAGPGRGRPAVPGLLPLQPARGCARHHPVTPCPSR